MTSSLINMNTGAKKAKATQELPKHDLDIRRRMRRNRSDEWIRRMVSENTLQPSDFIWPLFVIEGDNEIEDIPSMPGVSRRSIDKTIAEVKRAKDAGIPAIALFPIVPDHKKDALGTESGNADNLICNAVKQIKDAVPGIGIITDVALDPFTDHGHDGIIQDGRILNDETVEILCQQSLVQAQAGADIIAPSDMMDGRIAAIRDTLDENGFQDVKIMSYAAKYASSFYGPFRDAVKSGGFLKGDKKTYQMDPANGREALHEVEIDLEEGADMVMVKPGLPYLDVIQSVKQTFQIPTMAYHVSGEYAMLRFAAEAGALDYNKCVLETMLCFKRAGADAVLTYASMDLVDLLEKDAFSK